MQELDLILKIAEIILFVALTIAAVYLIISLKKISISVTKMETGITELETRLTPVLDNASVISGNMIDITTSVKGQMAKVETVVDSVKERADSLINFEKKAQREVETYVFDSLNFVSAVVTGFKTFASRIRGSNGKASRRVKEYLEESSEDDDY